jgi:hypothetical protein
MRISLIILPLAMLAAPAMAQQPPVAPTPAPPIQIPPQLADPAVAERLANTVQALSRAVLDLPVGGIEAAVEGRQPTPAERHQTIGDIARRDDPNFDRKFHQRIAQAGPMVHQSIKAMNNALPAMMQGLRQAEKALERAAANMPDPSYPKR